MKKLYLLISFILISIGAYSLEVFSPKAPPALPLLGTKGINLNLVEDVRTQIIPKVIQRRKGLYVLPLNVGGQLYNKNTGIELIGTISDGLLSYISTSSKDISGLRNKELYVGAQGSSPDVVIQEILKNKKISADIKYRSSQEIAKLMIAGKVKDGILPEPLATLVLKKNKKLRRVVQLKEKWPGKVIPQVGIFYIGIKNEEGKKEIAEFVKNYRTALKTIDDNILTEFVNSFGVNLDKETLKTSIKKMNLTFRQDKVSVENYLGKLGIKVDDEFYGY